jgi:hypothetical protein
MAKSEVKIHAEIYTYFHNYYPHLRGCLCYNLNNSANAIQGNLNKQLGLQKGRSDLALYYMGKAYFLELKDETGKQMNEQKEWQKIMEAHGFDYIVLRSLEDFKKFLEKNLIK